MTCRWTMALAGSLLLCLITTSTLAAEPWIAYTSKAYRLSTSLPGKPEIEKKVRPADAEWPRRRTVVATVVSGDTQAYVLGVTEYLVDRPRAPMEQINSKIDRLQINSDAPLVTRTELQIGGYPAVDVVIGPTSDGLFFRDRLIVKGKLLIELVAMRQSEPPSLDRFYTDFAFQP